VQQYESHLSVRADHTATNVFTRRFKILSQSAIAFVSQKLASVEGVQTLDTVGGLHGESRRAMNTTCEASASPSEPVHAACQWDAGSHFD
jgi:hypothetical protein